MTTPSPLDRPIGRLLSMAQAVSPQDVVEAVAMTVAEIDGRDVTLFLLDYEQATLRPSSDRLPHLREPEPVSAEGSMVGRCFWTQGALAVQRDDGWVAWVPVTERADRIGVLELVLPRWDQDLEDFCLELGVATAHLVIAAARYSDQIHLVRRRRDMTLAAEMQWSLLPPVAFGVGTTTIAGLLEPAYDVGGDCFDYALNGRVLDLAVFDAMGHGVGSAMLASLAIGAYRNGRRNRESLVDVLEVVDQALTLHGGSVFATALLAQFDTERGTLSWISAGHAAPLIARRGSVLAEGDHVPGLPLGLRDLGTEPATMYEVSLEPGDAVLMFTDGVIDARSQEGEYFGEDRLRDLLARESASGLSPSEVLRRLVHSALAYQGDGLRDDASMVYLHWGGPPDAPITGRH